MKTYIGDYDCAVNWPFPGPWCNYEEAALAVVIFLVAFIVLSYPRGKTP